MTNTMPKTSDFSLNQLRKSVAYLPIYAGVLLLALLPVGMLFGVYHSGFALFFLAHSILVLFAVFASIFLFLACVRQGALSSIPLLGSLVIFLGLIALISSVPITSRDALIHHLAVPRWWLETGYIDKISWHEWSYYPMLINLGFTALLSFGLESLTPFYHAAFLLMLCGTVCSFTLYKTRDYDAASLSFLMMLTIPAAFKLATVPLVDLGLALFSTQAICHFVYWAEGKHKFSHLLVAGLGFGLSLGCKYNALLSLAVFVPLATLYATQVKVGFFRFIGATILLGALIAAAYFPWAVKNYYWTQNPIYPLFSNLFSSAGPNPATHSVQPLLARIGIYNESWLDILLIPLRMLVNGTDDVPSRFDGVLSPIFILAAYTGIKLRKLPWNNLFGLHILFYLCFALMMSSARVRYLAPIFGSLVILSSVGIFEIGKYYGGRYKKEAYLACASIFLLWAAMYSGNLLRSTKALPYVLWQQSKHEYLLETITEYSVIDFMNHNLPEDSLVYLLNTGNRFYYHQRKVISGGHFSASLLINWIKASPNLDVLYGELHNRKITHIMTETNLSRSSLRNLLSPTETAVWNDFQIAHLELVHLDGPYTLWKIK